MSHNLVSNSILFPEQNKYDFLDKKKILNLGWINVSLCTVTLELLRNFPSRIFCKLKI